VLKADPRFGRCATEKLFSYALGRTPTAKDLPRLDALAKSFADASFQLRTLVDVVATDDAFRFKRGDL
jgi:hypothetical protein